MSSKAERRARSVHRMKKQHMKSLQSKRKKNGDDDSSDDDDGADGSLMPTPKQLNLAERGKAGPSKKKRKLAAANQGDESGGSMRNMATALPTPDFATLPPYPTSHWRGAAGEDPPSEGLKARRKSIGVLVRGNLRACPPPVADAADAALPPAFAAAFQTLQLQTPSPIQMQAWPAALAGANILAIAPTGSGKTLAYALSMVVHVEGRVAAAAAQPQPTNVKAPAAPSSSSSSSPPAPLALVLVPTRELAIQVGSAVKSLRRGLSCVVLYGGVDKDAQVSELKRAHATAAALHAVVATPGRLLDLLATKKVTLTRATFLVLDEADRMLAMGFRDQLDHIARLVRPDRQTLMFTATFPGNLREAAERWVPDAVVIRCNAMEMHHQRERPDAAGADGGSHGGGDGDGAEGEADGGDGGKPAKKGKKGAEEGDGEGDEGGEGADESTSAAATGRVNNNGKATTSVALTISPTVTQHVHVCATHKKPRLLIRFLSGVRDKEKADKVRQPGAMLVFANKIKTVAFCHDFLRRQGVVAEMLHGNLQQRDRETVLANFKAGKTHTLISTDVAARGIHIKRLKYVVNYDFPANLEQYCHRVGRTGRQGEEGHAYSLVTRNMAPLANDLISLLRSTNQTVEPNLLNLADEFTSGNFVWDEDAEEKEGEKE